MQSNDTVQLKRLAGISSLDEKLADLRCSCHNKPFKNVSELAIHLAQVRNGHKKGRGQALEECTLEQCRSFRDCDCLGFYGRDD